MVKQGYCGIGKGGTVPGRPGNLTQWPMNLPVGAGQPQGLWPTGEG